MTGRESLEIDEKKSLHIKGYCGFSARGVNELLHYNFYNICHIKPIRTSCMLKAKIRIRSCSFPND